LRHGEAVTIEMKIRPSHQPWKAELQYQRFGRMKRIFFSTARYLPRRLQSWVAKNFFNDEFVRLEVDAMPDSTRYSLPP
jgi:hypothetical protein